MDCKDALDWLSIFISFGAFVFSLAQFFCERSRNRKEATIHAFDQLEANDSVIKLFSLPKSTLDGYVEDRINNVHRVNKDWAEISLALSLIEHFAVGVNHSIYDIEILNSMAGNKMISVFSNCENVLQYKRKGTDSQKNYVEFENMINKLKKLRNKNKS